MTKWHQTRPVDLGLRVVGAALLAAGWAIAVRLHQLAPAASPRDAGSLLLFLSATAFLCASAGSALLFVGGGLWERVEVSERWRRVAPPDARAERHLGA
ncbi:MAG TPA: hypothetical protein VEZ59_08370 [Sphingopyxis sp.]|nr:hypothetical protein [Sphingopyxis sp.]